MFQSVAVVDASAEECRKLCVVLDHGHYRAIALHSLYELVEAIQESPCHAVILDLDSLPVDNSFIKELRKLKPSVCVIGISSRTFHPELEEAMRTHICACLGKPVDMDELTYCLKNVCGAEPSSRASPEECEY